MPGHLRVIGCFSLQHPETMLFFTKHMLRGICRRSSSPPLPSRLQADFFFFFFGILSKLRLDLRLFPLCTIAQRLAHIVPTFQLYGTHWAR